MYHIMIEKDEKCWKISHSREKVGLTEDCAHVSIAGVQE